MVELVFHFPSQMILGISQILLHNFYKMMYHQLQKKEKKKLKFIH